MRDQAFIKPIIEDRKFYLNHGFYGFFLQTPDIMEANFPDGVVEPDKVYTLLGSTHQSAMEGLLSHFPGSTLECSLKLEAVPLSKESVLADEVEKNLLVRTTCKASYSKAEKEASFAKRVKVYNLLPAITSRFTFYHSNDIGDMYNQFRTDREGRALPGGPGRIPLLLFNHSSVLSGDDDPLADKNLLKPNGDPNNTDSFNKFADVLEKMKHRDAILQRGYLFFGSGQDNHLNLTPGSRNPAPKDAEEFSNPALRLSQYYHLFNKYLFDRMGTYPATSVKTPDYLMGFPITYQYADSREETHTAKARIRSYYRGCYEDVGGFDPDYPENLLTDYPNASSLIHPFGTYMEPSRAYTVGTAKQVFARTAYLFIDRDEGDDETDNKNCASRFPAPDDARLNLPSSLSLEPHAINWSKMLHNERSSCGSEPPYLILDDDFTPENAFEDYDKYKTYMSSTQRIPLNHILDYPHHSHSTVPPNRDEEFEKFMFPPYDSLEEPEFYESPDEIIPIIEGSSIQPEHANYVSGPARDFAPQDIHRNRYTWHSFGSMEDLEHKGILVKKSNRWILESDGQAIHLLGPLNLDKPLVVLNDIHLQVDGQCLISPVQSKFLFSLSCQNIVFMSDDIDPDEPAAFDGFYQARGRVSKIPNMPMVIYGGLATGRLDLNSMFSSLSMVVYNQALNPQLLVRDYMYRIAVDDHVGEYRSRFYEF
jgi:hypothetical protein